VIRIGLIGCGAVVRETYSKMLRGRSEYGVAYACDTNAEQAAAAAETFGAEVASLDQVVDAADAIIVSTPPSTHADLVGAALRKDRIVLCEKPFMTSTADAERAVAAADEAGALLRVSHFRRTYPQVELARDLVRLGAIGDVQSFSASEGGRFTWRSVSDYPVRDPSGGVLWDTGSHTIDTVLFAAGLDESPFTVGSARVTRDKPEPSHEFRARFVLSRGDGADVAGKLHVSRRDVLPNLITIRGTRGTIDFVVGLDDRLRLTSETGTAVMQATSSYTDLMECFDLQVRRIMLRDRDDDFAARRFVGQVRILDALVTSDD
jgi:predicted dehydrogenase